MKFSSLSLALAVASFAGIASAANVSSLTIVDVDTFNTPTPGTWYGELRMTPGSNGGTASIVSVAGVGGNLETNAPNNDGVARLTTGSAATTGNGDKSAVTTYGNFGPALTGLPALTASYSYYKTASADNAAAAPAFRIQLLGSGTGDNFGTLVYEPYWNLGTNPPTDTWQTETITGTQGQFWWNGGFEQPNTAGGPPLHTLSEWAAIFAASDPVDFATAGIISYSTGIGSSNPGQTTYVDNIAFNTPTFAGGVTNFVAVPEPTTLAALGAAGTLLRRRRRA